MIVNKYNNGGGGSISGGSADYATSAGTALFSDKTLLLEGINGFPVSATTGDVVAINGVPTRGLRSGSPEAGVYQYDGSNWNKIEGGEGSSAYKIELSSVDPQYYTQQDRETLIDFYTAFTADTSIADSAYIYAADGIYRCVRYIAIPNSPVFTFEGTFNDNIVDIWLHFSDGRFSYGSLQNAVPTPPTPEFTSLKPASDFPEDPVEGEIVLLSEEALIDYKPEAPDGHTVYGGSLADFMVAIKGTSNNQLWVSTWDDAGHTERTDQGYFHLESDAIDFYDYQGDMDYLFNDLNEGEWVDANTIFLWKEGKNLYFYVKQEAEGVFFPDTQSNMEFDTVVTDNTLNQYSEGVGWDFFPQVLNGRADFPKVMDFGDVVGLGKYEEREATSADVFTSATVTMVNGRATFKMYNPNYSGYCEEYTFGYENGAPFSPWGTSGNVINGPWSDQGVEFTIDGDDITFTTQNPENTNEALQMWGFDPNCNDRITTKELGIYQYDGTDWQQIGGDTYVLPAATRQTLGGIKVGNGLSIGADGTLSATGSGGSSYISDLQALGINILEGNGVGYVSNDDGQGNPTQYTTIEPSNDGSASVNNYTDDGQGGWMQSESYQLLRLEDVKNAQDDVMASGIVDGSDNVLRVDPDSDGTTQVGTYEPGEGDEPTFTRQRYLVSSTNISKMVKITQSDYESLVNNQEVDENTFYIVVADPNEP